MKKEYERALIIIGVIGIIIGIIIFLTLNIDLAGLMINFTQEYYDSFGEIGVYAAIFLLSIIGNFTIILPVPYLLALASVIIMLPVNPLIIGLFAGLGAAIGELSAWLIGRGAGEVAEIDKKKGRLSKNIKGLKTLINKGFGFPLIILFAATPLPDDVLLIALGMAKYSLKKSLTAAFIGKVIMTMTVSGFSVIAKAFPAGQFVLSLYGLKIVDGTAVSTQNPLVSNITLIITILLIFLIVIIDWEKLFKKFKKKD